MRALHVLTVLHGQAIIFQGFSEIFWRIGNLPYLCNPFAEIAQLVEHNLAKVGVASSSLVFRSIKRLPSGSLFFVWMYGLPDSDSRPLPEGAVGGAD